MHINQHYAYEINSMRINMHIHIYICIYIHMPACQQPAWSPPAGLQPAALQVAAVALVQARTKAKPLVQALPAAALPAAPLVAAGMEAYICRCMYMYMHIVDYMENDMSTVRNTNMSTAREIICQQCGKSHGD